MQRYVVLGLRVLLVVALVGLVVSQGVVVALGLEMAGQFPEVDYLRIPFTVAGIAVLACVQVALVCVWQLVSMVRRATVFCEAAYPWVDAIAWSGVVAAVLTTAMNIYLSYVVKGNPPLVFLVLTGGAVAGLGLALVMVVMKALLRSATVMRADLAQVV